MEHHLHLTDDLPLAYFLYNKDYAVIDCNRAAVNIFAHDKGKNLELVRTYLISQARHTYPNYASDPVFTEEVIRGACEQALTAGVFRFDHTFLTLSGSAIPCEVTIVPMMLEDGQGYVHYLRDLNDIQRVNNETRRREVAEEANRTKSRFLARMSHEIRTPMQAVLGIAELLMTKDDLLNDVREAVTRINSASDLLIATLDDILDLAKVEAGKMEMYHAPYETARLIINTVQLNCVHIHESLQLKIEVDEHTPRRLVGDEMRIQQVLNNVLSNAFKYTAEGEVTFSITTETSTTSEFEPHDEETVYLVLTVRDTGQGLTSEQSTQIFDSEFVRFGAQTNVSGSGLGLAVVKQLVELMHGTITAHSVLGEGTTITVRIPQLTQGDDELGAAMATSLQNPENHRALLASLPDSKKMDIDSSPMPYGKVLVVDDIESSVYVVQGILSHYQLQIEIATNGKEAVEKVKAGAVYDIIFMDHMMPVMDGEEATRTLREMGYTHPIIALTANVVDASDLEFTRRGFNGYLGKPINLNQLTRCLNFYIRKKHAEQVLTQATIPVIKPTVLIIDDAPATLTLLNDMLKTDYKVLAARSARIAFAILAKQKVDLMLLDLSMPNVSGFDMLEELKIMNNTVPIIIISASEQPLDQVRGMAMGAVDFLRKPFETQNVLHRVKLHLNDATTQRSNEQ